MLLGVDRLMGFVLSLMGLNVESRLVTDDRRLGCGIHGQDCDAGRRMAPGAARERVRTPQRAATDHWMSSETEQMC